MSNVITMTSKFQISIPKAARQSKNWSAGQKLVLISDGEGFLLRPAPTIESLRGIAKGVDLSDYRDRVDRY